MDDAQARRALMDRLQSLETKIRQLNKELQRGSGAGNRAISSPTEEQKQMTSENSSRRMVEGELGQASADMVENQRSKKACCTSKRVLRWMRSCVVCTDCTGDDDCCLNSSSTDVCEAQGIHATCYH